MKEGCFIRAYKYWIVPETAQSEPFLKGVANAFGQTRFVYNKLKDYVDRKLDNREKLPSKTDLNNYVNRKLKKQHPFLRGSVDKFCFTHAAYQLHDAYSAFLEGKRGQPHFRKKSDSVQSFTTNFTNNNIKVDEENGIVELPYFNKRKGCPVKAVIHRSVQGRIIGAHVVRHATGDYYAVIICEVKIDELPENEKAAGLDLGIKDSVVCSDGTVIHSVRALYQSEKSVKRTQKSLSRKYEAAKKRTPEGCRVQLSKNYLKEKAKLARKHERVRNQRYDLAQKTSNKIVNENQIIIIEDLHVKGMLKNHHLAKAIADAGFYQLRRCIEYKAYALGRILVRVDRWLPSSQLCSHCRYQNKEVKNLSIRVWECPNCHTVHQRDVNAAKVIKAAGLEMLSKGYYHSTSCRNAAKLSVWRGRYSQTNLTSPQ